MNLFAARLKWLRERMNITQKEMAEKIGVSQQYYNKFEKGTGQPNLETLYKIRGITGESLDFLIGFYFEDSKAVELYELYIEARRNRQETEEDIEYSNKLLDFPGDDMERRLKLIRRYKDELNDLKPKEERAFNNFFDYISAIPGFEGDVANKEYWIEFYDEYQESDKRVFHEFWTEFQDL